LGILRRVLDPQYLQAANAVTAPQEVAILRPGADALHTRMPMWPAGRDVRDAMFLYDQQTYLPPLLQRQDRMSMAAGVEARVVFLDHALAEWANGLPAGVKVPGGARKQLLKDVAAQWIPAGIRERRKVGFTLPLGAWLRERDVLGKRVERLRDPAAFVRTLVVPRELDVVLAEHARGEVDHADVIWSLLALETWADVFLRNRPSPHALPGARTGRVPAVGARGASTSAS
jgi:asparagine synthetase B (glutamine-hydrolysing)